MNDFVDKSSSSLTFFSNSGFLKNSLTINCTPLPVASSLPTRPFLLVGFPVTHADPLISDG